MGDRLQHLINEVEDRKRRTYHLLKHLIRFKTPAPPASNTEEAQHLSLPF